MSTMLVVAEPKDRLAQRVCELVPDVIRCTEYELFAACDFALLQDGVSVEGTLTIQGRSLRLAQLSGVLFRPVGRWRPPSALGARRRVFVRHETHAAWCAVLNALPCPVLNRMPPAWWLDDAAHRVHLAHAFARQLALPLSPSDYLWVADRRRVGWRAPPAGNVASVYVVGKQLVTVDPGLHALRTRLSAHEAQLEQWQHATGIGFARLDFAYRNGYEVERVEPIPAMGRVPAELLESVSRHAAAVLA